MFATGRHKPIEREEGDAMINLPAKKVQIIEVEPTSTYLVVLCVLDGYEIGSEAAMRAMDEIESGFEALGCPRANVSVAIMQGVEVIKTEKIDQ